VPTSLMRLERWFREELPSSNRVVLAGGSPTRVAESLATVLPHLPSPDTLSVREAQRLTIGLGLAGASVARHHQEQDPRRKDHPERSFDGLLAGPDLIPFQRYFAWIAERTETGHCARDTYASLVIWNVPTTEVRFEGGTLATLPGVTDNDILSYTGHPSERWFFRLVKRGQTLERAVNNLLEPIADDDMDPVSPWAVHRVEVAATLLEALRRLFLEFADGHTGRGMQPQYFMDVFRQFATHWVVGDIPPSGALDVDALKRDFLLGTVNDQYRRPVERLMPALLAAERQDLARWMAEPSLPERLLARLGLDRDVLAAASPEHLRGLTGAHPAVRAWYVLLANHARAAGAHLMLSKRFLFNPQRRRDDEGIGDRELVSNRRGTTGMDESVLDRLARMRRDHHLADLRRSSVCSKPPATALSVASVEILPVLAGRGEADFRAALAPVGQRVSGD
jgi:hypothetical protein